MSTTKFPVTLAIRALRSANVASQQGNSPGTVDRALAARGLKRTIGARQARELAAKLLVQKDASIVVYCASASCLNSHQAAQTPTDLGYTDVRVYVEGKADWQAAGLSLER